MPRVAFFRRARPRGVPIAELYRDLLARWSPGNTVVDVGCMWNVDGAHAFHAVDRGATRVVGLDIEPATPAFVAENAARAAAGRGGVEFVQGDVNDPALGIGPFDVVFCAGVLYHVPDPVFTLRRLRALCRKTLILGTTVFPEQSTPQTAVFLPGLDARARERLTYPTRGMKRGLDSDLEPEKGYGTGSGGSRRAPCSPCCVSPASTSSSITRIRASCAPSRPPAPARPVDRASSFAISSPSTKGDVPPMGYHATVDCEALRVDVAPGAVIPLLGDVAAGLPIQSFPVDRTIELPPALWNGRNVFALRVRGTSMIDEGIRDGDYLIVEPRERADNGQTVVAEVDGGVTVKRIFRERGGRLRLQPANAEMLPLIVPAERVRIVGAVVGVFRRQGFRPRRPRRRPVPTDGRTFDLTLHVLEQRLQDADAIARTHRGEEASDLARSLRSLRDCYLETHVPRLRAALLREAGDVIRRLRRFGVEPAAT